MSKGPEWRVWGECVTVRGGGVSSLTKDPCRKVVYPMGQTLMEGMRLYFVSFLPPSLVHILPHMQGSLP